MTPNFKSETFKEGKKGRKPLTDEEVALIKRKLNIPGSAPFPKCPAKSGKAIERLRVKYQEPWHADKSHAPCDKCTCPYTAGLGTEHFGYGYCHLHEKAYGPMIGKTMELADLRAHQQRHPRVFQNAGEFLKKTTEDADLANKEFDLTAQLDKAKLVLSDMYSRLSTYETDRSRCEAEMVQKLDAVKTILECMEFSEDTKGDRALILMDLADIRTRLTCPLTEKGAGGSIEMTSKTIYELQLSSANVLTQIAERVQKIKAVQMVTQESFKAWLGVFLQHLKREFGSLTYTRSEGTFQIIEGIGECARRSGDPRRGM